MRKAGFRCQVSGVRAALLLFSAFLIQPSAFPQQPQAQSGQTVFPVNAKFVNGVAPGYWPTAGSGMTLNLSPGSTICNGTTPISYAGGTLAMTASSTNYVYLNASASCAPASNTTGFTAGNSPIAIVTAGTSSLAVSDWRPMGVGAGGLADPGSDGIVKRTALNSTSPAAYSDVMGLFTGCSGTQYPGADGNCHFAGPALETSGLMAWHRMLPTETVGALVDYSGSGNGATGTNGTPPAIIAGSGGINCGGAGGVNLPAALNSATTIQLVVGWQDAADNSGGYSAALGGGSATGLFSLLMKNTAGYPSLTLYRYGIGAANFPDVADGIVVLTDVKSATADTLYVNATQLVDFGTTSSIATLGAQASGNYALCGQAASFFLKGQIYSDAFYSRPLTASDVAINVAGFQGDLAARGVILHVGSTAANGAVVVNGDSIPSGYGVATPLYYYLSLNNGLSKYVLASNGLQVAQAIPNGQTEADVFCASGVGRNGEVMWAGGNDIALGSLTPAQAYANLSAYSQQRGQAGCKRFVMSMMSRTGQDANKDTFDALVEAGWRSVAEGLIDVASDARLGPDAAYSNSTYFQADGIHPSQFTHAGILARLISRGVNRVFGNLDFTSARTIATGTPGAWTITAASESGQVANLTVSNTAVVGQVLTVAGMTPAGYNCTSCTVQTVSASTIGYEAQSTGLGAGTGFGTALVPTQIDADTYINLGVIGSPQTHLLDTCVGYTGQRLYINNANTAGFAWTLQGWGSENVGSANTLATTNGHVIILEAKANAYSTGGCNWVVVQQ